MPGYGHDYGHGYGHEAGTAPPTGTGPAWGSSWGEAWSGEVLLDPWGTMPWGGVVPPPVPVVQEAWYLPPVTLGHRAPHYLNRFDRIGIPRSHQYRQFLRNYVDAGQVVGDTPSGDNIYGWVGGRWNGPLTDEQILVIEAAGQATRIARVPSIYDLPPDLENVYGEQPPAVPAVGFILTHLPRFRQAGTGTLGIAGEITDTLPELDSRVVGGLANGGEIAEVLPALMQYAAGSAGSVAGTIATMLPALDSAVVARIGAKGTIHMTLPPIRTFASQAPVAGTWGGQNVLWGDTHYNWRGDYIP